ncbi:MAG: T9SS type A sorting domain-containing protein, partial [candidate division WOR-3 bacterium]
DSFALKYTTYPPHYPGIEEYDELVNVPNRTTMSNLYPNPFYQKTVIRYQIADREKTQYISLKIYDVAGRLVKQFNHLMPYVSSLAASGGNHHQSLINQVTWHGDDDAGRRVSAGVYFVQFEVGDYKQIEKAVLLK